MIMIGKFFRRTYQSVATQCLKCQKELGFSGETNRLGLTHTVHTHRLLYRLGIHLSYLVDVEQKAGG